MHRDHWYRILPIVLCIFIFSLPRLSAANTSWWNDRWKYRLITRVVPPERRGEINTARVKFREQSRHCAPKGRDIRVIDHSGKVVPHRVKTGKRGLTVMFRVRPQAQTYYVYYGNPDARAVKHQWEERLGGLTLETFELPRKTYRAKDLPSLLEANPERYGRSAWPQINDLKNPFGKNDRYISRYTGTIYCAEQGPYTFALNADDMALFRLMMDKKTIVSAWRDGGVPSETWKDPEHGHAYVTTPGPLKPGVYRFVYFHGENGGAQLAKLGWEKPSSDAVTTVPPRAFIQYLPVTIRGREKLDRTLNPFFTEHHRYTLSVNGGKVSFPRYHFKSRSKENKTSIVSYQWSFGDGTQATGRSVSHEFPELKPYDVTLSIKTKAGDTASITRRVFPSPEPRKRMTIRMDAQFENQIPILPAGQQAQLKIFIKNISGLPHALVFQNLLAQNDGKGKHRITDEQTIARLKPSSGGPSGWRMLRTSFALPEKNVYSRLQLLMHGRSIVERDLAVLSTHGPLDNMQIDRSGNLRDAANRLVLLRLAGVSSTNAPDRQLCHPDSGTIRVLSLNQSLVGRGHDDEHFVRSLTELFKKRYPSLTIVPSRPRTSLRPESTIISRFLETRRKILDADPNIVILATRPETVLNNVPQNAFRAYLIATLDQIQTQTSAGIVMVTPAPLPARPALSSKYAAIMKRVGLKTGVTVTDLYSRLRLTPDWKKFFRQPGSQHPSHNIHLNENGQKLLARKIFNSLIHQYGDELAVQNEQMEH